MKKIFYRLTSAIFIISIIILSALPNSAVLHFGVVNEYGDIGISSSYYSCFDLMNVGYANFGPFLSGIFACLLLILLVISIFIKNKKFDKVIFIISIIGFVLSLLPIIGRYITIYTIIISSLWFCIVIISALVSFNIKKLVKE